MRITIVCIGRLRDGPEQALIRPYLERIGWPTKVTEIEIARPPRSTAKRLEEEAERLLAAIPAGAYHVALDRRGKALSSDDFAALIAKTAEAGRRDLAFSVGGADGLSARVIDTADRVVSFGPMVWPHRLARVMLAEQLYRAHAILTRHPYHRG